MKQHLKSILSGLGAFALFATLWQWGYQFGNNQSNAVLDFVKEERNSLRIKVEKSETELNTLKSELLLKNFTTTPIANNSPNKNVADSTKTENKQSIHSEEKTINTQSTESFLSGNVEITVIAINFSGNPLRHRVTANALIPGKSPLEIRNADPGSAYNYGNYQISITASGTFSAKFKVFDLNYINSLHKDTQPNIVTGERP